MDVSCRWVPLGAEFAAAGPVGQQRIHGLAVVFRRDVDFVQIVDVNLLAGDLAEVQQDAVHLLEVLIGTADQRQVTQGLALEAGDARLVADVDDLGDELDFARALGEIFFGSLLVIELGRELAVLAFQQAPAAGHVVRGRLVEGLAILGQALGEFGRLGDLFLIQRPLLIDAIQSGGELLEVRGVLGQFLCGDEVLFELIDMGLPAVQIRLIAHQAISPHVHHGLQDVAFDFTADFDFGDIFFCEDFRLGADIEHAQRRPDPQRESHGDQGGKADGDLGGEFQPGKHDISFDGTDRRREGMLAHCSLPRNGLVGDTPVSRAMEYRIQWGWVEIKKRRVLPAGRCLMGTLKNSNSDVA